MQRSGNQLAAIEMRPNKIKISDSFENSLKKVRLESTLRYSPGRPGWVPAVRETLVLVASPIPPSVGSPVAPDVNPERDDEHGCGGVVEDGAEDSFYAFIQGHGFPPPLSNLCLVFGLAALP